LEGLTRTVPLMLSTGMNDTRSLNLQIEAVYFSRHYPPSLCPAVTNSCQRDAAQDMLQGSVANQLSGFGIRAMV
jgi:hypothetical protein